MDEMKKSLVMAGAVVALSSGVAAAQGLNQPVCPAGGTTTVSGVTIPDPTRVAQDACQQAYDLYQFMGPQLGLALAGGNATIGQGGVLGGLGHFSVGVRGNVFNGRLPEVDKFTQSTNGAQKQTLPAKDQILGLPTADAAIGIFKGLPLGLTNVGGIDALVSAAYVPTISGDEVSITPQNNWQFGWGARVGLLSESIVVPGVSVTWIERDLPETDIVGTSTAGNSTATLKVNNFKVKTSAWRVVASKSFIVFGLAAGVGQDKYSQSAAISATYTGTCTQSGVTVSCNGTTTIPGTSQDMTRTNAFVDLSLNLPLFKIVAEAGQVSGGTVNTYNTIGTDRADRSQVYGSLGLRLSW
jgi:hypothetical protein